MDSLSSVELEHHNGDKSGDYYAVVLLREVIDVFLVDADGLVIVDSRVISDGGGRTGLGLGVTLTLLGTLLSANVS